MFSRFSRVSQLTVVLVLATGLFYGLTVRSGHNWGDDFAMYLLEARNIADGQPYAQTGYIYNPDVPHIGPTAYTPLLPLLLAPIILVAGLNLTWMKLVLAAAFLVALAAMTHLFSRYLPAAWAVAVAAVFAWNPSVWDFHDVIGSDMLLLPFVYLFLLSVDRGEGEGSRSHSIWNGVLIWAACSARTPGLVLIPTLIIYDLLRRRRITIATVNALLVAAVMIALQSWLLHPGKGYAIFTSNPGAITYAIYRYFRLQGDLWLNGFSTPFSYVVYAAAWMLAGWGIWSRRRGPVAVFDIFAVLYCMVIIPYDAQVYRYLFPVLPIFLFYVLLGLHALPIRWAKPAMAVATSALVITYVGQYARANWGPISEGIGDSNFQAMCRYIDTNTDRSSVFVSRTPRLLALMTQRSASVYPKSNPGDWVRKIHADYVLTAAVPLDKFTTDRTVLLPYVKSAGLAVVHAEGPYTLYKVQ